ncbi:MAG: signal peptide peptidase SppA [Planctomycetota bacterium]
MPDTVGWIELRGPLRDGPIRQAWLSEDEVEIALQTILDQLAAVRDGDQYLGVVLYLDQPSMTATQVDAIYHAMREVRDAQKTVVTFSQAYTTREYVLASAGDLIVLQHKGEVALEGLHIEEMYLRGLLDKLGVQPQMIQVGRYKGASEQMTRTGPSDSWSKNMDGLLDDMYAVLIERIGQGRGLDRGQVEAIMADSWTLSDQDLLRRGIVDRLAGRDLINVTEIEFGDDFVWDVDMGHIPAGPAVVAGDNPVSMLGALLSSPGTTTSGPTIAVLHLNGAIVSGDSAFGGGMFGGETIGSRTVELFLDEALYDDNIKGVVIRIDSPGGSALASEIMWQSIREFGESKPIYCSVGGMAASGGYYIASACDEIYVEPRSILGSIGVVAGKINLKGLYDLVGISVHTRSRGPNADLLSSVTNFTDEEREKLTASMTLVYQQFRDRVATGRGARLKDLDAVDEGMLFTGRQCVQSGMADKLGGTDDAVADMARQLGLESGDYDILQLPPPISLADYLATMLEGPGLPFGLQSPESAGLLAATRALVGPQAWQQLTRALTGISLLREEQNLLLMPQVIVVK